MQKAPKRRFFASVLHLRFQSLLLRMTPLCDAFVLLFRRHQGTALRSKFMIPYIILHSVLCTLHYFGTALRWRTEAIANLSSRNRESSFRYPLHKGGFCDFGITVFRGRFLFYLLTTVFSFSSEVTLFLSTLIVRGFCYTKSGIPGFPGTPHCIPFFLKDTVPDFGMIPFLISDFSFLICGQPPSKVLHS